VGSPPVLSLLYTDQREGVVQEIQLANRALNCSDGQYFIAVPPSTPADKHAAAEQFVQEHVDEFYIVARDAD
jgi:hypothetical protein